GRPKSVGAKQWVPIETPNGEGWVDRFYLTEQVDFEAFKEDRRPAQQVKKLADRLRSGADITSAVSERGLAIGLTGSPTRIRPERLAELLDNKSWIGMGGLEAGEDFNVAVAIPFLEAMDATEAISAATPHSGTALIPNEFLNLPYLALGAPGVQPWLVFFEYSSGKPRIAALGIDE
ncbi:MAG: hypothetical protein ACR2NL_09045, partial [Acidimicrobiia bacterium]